MIFFSYVCISTILHTTVGQLNDYKKSEGQIKYVVVFDLILIDV